MDSNIYRIFSPSGWEGALKGYIIERYNFREERYGISRNKGPRVIVAGLDEPLISVVGRVDKGYRIKPDYDGLLETVEGKPAFAEKDLLFTEDELDVATPLRAIFYLEEREGYILGSNAGYRAILEVLLNTSLPVVLLEQTLFNSPYTLLPLIEDGVKTAIFVLPYFSVEKDTQPFIVDRCENFVLKSPPDGFKRRSVSGKLNFTHYYGYRDFEVIPVAVPVLGKKGHVVFRETLVNLDKLLRRLYEEENKG